MFIQPKIFHTKMLEGPATHPSWPVRFSHTSYEACPENIQPFWISREPVAWPWCN